MDDTWNSADKFNREAAQRDEKPQLSAVALCVAKAIIAATNPKKNMQALEFGCGSGLVSMKIAPQLKTLSAIDTSKEMLAVLKEKIRFSGITDMAGFQNQHSNLLSPGGSLALTDLDVENGLFHDDPLEKVHHGFEREELAALLNVAGLQVRSFETIFTCHKTNRADLNEAYPVFFVTSLKTPLTTPE